MPSIFSSKKNNYQSTLQSPAYVSFLSSKQQGEIKTLYLQISSLKEILHRYKKQRIEIELNHSTQKKLDILKKEFNTVQIIEENYLQLKNHLIGLQNQSHSLPRQIDNELHQKCIQFDKEITTLRERKHILRLLIEKEEKQSGHMT